MIRVLIADDSQVVLEYVKYILESTGDFEVVGTAKDGEEAVSLVHRVNPSVVLMDINMPRMNGYEATREIMETKPVPIVIFSASWKPEDTDKTFQAMEAGALAVTGKPPGPGNRDAEPMIRELLQTVRLMSEVPVVRRWSRLRERRASLGPQEVGVSDHAALIAIGASTGGPPVLHTIFSSLPKDFPAP
ncbi:MAG: response regulator, partial [bacterium]